MTVRSRLIKVIAEETGINAKEIKDESRFAEDLNCDSLDLFEIALTVEEEFEKELRGKMLPDDAFSEVRTVADAVKLVSDLI